MAAAPFRLVEERDALAGLREAWRALDDAAGSPMQQHAWLSAAAHTLARGRRLQIVVVGPLERPAAVAPLVRRRGAPARLELLGGPELRDPTDVVAHDDGAVRSLAGALVALGLPLVFDRVWADAPIVAALRDAYHHRGLVVSRPAPACPYIELDAGWVEPERKLGSRRRSDLRRARRRAEQRWAVTCEVLAPGPAEVGPLLDDVYGVEAAGWKGRQGTALAADRVRGEFFRSYARAASEQGTLRLCFLRVDGRPVAAQVAARCGRRLWLLKMGYDEAFAPCSPGMLLLLDVVRHAAEEQLDAFELLGSVEPWTGIWTDRAHACLRVHTYPTRVQSLLAAAVDAGALARQELAHHRAAHDRAPAGSAGRR